MTDGPIALVVMVAVAGVAAIVDVRTGRIPNALTGALAVSALVLHAFGGVRELSDAAITMVAVLLIGTVAFSLRWFGGGDVKLLAGCAAIVGSRGIAPLLLDVLVAGGVLVLIDAARRRRLRALLSSTAGVAVGLAPVAQTKVPYGVAIAAGCLVYSISLLVSPALRPS
jgi:prepilin peptidase CpaA